MKPKVAALAAFATAFLLFAAGCGELTPQQKTFLHFQKLLDVDRPSSEAMTSINFMFMSGHFGLCFGVSFDDDQYIGALMALFEAMGIPQTDDSINYGERFFAETWAALTPAEKQSSCVMSRALSIGTQLQTADELDGLSRAQAAAIGISEDAAEAQAYRQ